MRLNVALAAHPERLQALLNAYLHGPGRHLFSPASADQADAMIADHDHAPARAEMLRFRSATARPCIVLAQNDPGLPGMAWVSKPVSFEGLARAAALIEGLRSAPPAGPAPQAMPSPPAPPAAPRPAPTALTKPAVTAGDGAGTPAPVAAPSRKGNGLRAPRFVAAASDSGRSKGAWMAVGVVFILAVATAMGWEPEATMGRRSEEAASGAGANERREVAEALKWAVQASVRDYRMRSKGDERYEAYLLSQMPPARGWRADAAAPPDRHALHPTARNRVVVMSVGSATDPATYVRLNLKAAVALSAPGSPSVAPRPMALAPTARPAVSVSCDFMLDGRCMSLARVPAQE